MNNLISNPHGKILSNLSMNLKFVEAFFKYLPHQKVGCLKYTLTYFYETTEYFEGVSEIILEVERCIQYQISKNNEVSIPAEIVFFQSVLINEVEVELLYHGQLKLQDTVALIGWNLHQGNPTASFYLNDSLQPNELLSLFENFQNSVNDIIRSI